MSKKITKAWERALAAAREADRKERRLRESALPGQEGPKGRGGKEPDSESDPTEQRKEGERG